jgi:hypothetical protein
MLSDKRLIESDLLQTGLQGFKLCMALVSDLSLLTKLYGP